MLAQAFRRSRLVHLQGWGEPFLHPRFFEMAAAAKAAGCEVGTTTNAMLMSEETIARLVDSEIDVVAFSLAGTGKDNDRIRKGTRIDRVLEVIRSLSLEKERRHVQNPAIHIAYMLLRSGVEKIDHLPSLLKGLGVSQIVISTLDFASSEELLPEVLRPDTQAEYDRLRLLLQKVAAKFEEQSIGIHCHLPHPEKKRKECTENVRRALCISSDGAVTPCVFTNLDISGSFYFSGGERRPYRRLNFGKAGQSPLTAIWRDSAYKTFRASFRKGSLAAPCRNCPKLCG